MYGCESWTIKKAEHRRTDAFELWCWRRLLRVPWTAERSNQPILKEINPEYSLEGLMLKLKLQYFDHLMWKADLLEKTLMLWRQQEEKGTTEDEIVGWHHRLNGHEFEQAPGDGEGQGSLACYNPWGYKESDTTEWLNKKSLEGEPGPCPKVGQLFLHCSSLVSAYPPWVATVWNCPLELKKVQETGDTERISSPRSPIRFYSVSELMEVKCYFSKVFLYMDSPWCQLSNSGDKNCYPHLGTVFLGGSSLCVYAQSCPTLCSPTACSPPGSSIHGISQAGILGNHCGKRVATSSSRISFWPRDQTHVSWVFYTVRQVLYH